MRACKKCGEEKPLNEFYKSPGAKDGRESSCKECRKAMVRANRKRNLDYYRNYDRQRGNRHHPGYVKRYRQQNAIKQQAHNRVNHALIGGRIQRPDSCEECGESRHGVHAYHDDYAKQLDVRWLCPSCHHQWHAEHGEAKNADMEPFPRNHAVEP